MRRRHHTRGFTLIELLVVLVIIGIVVGVAVISLSALGRNPPAKAAAQELADLTGLAAEQAVMQGQEYGLRIEPHAYAFYTYDGRSWSVIKDDNLFHRRELGAELSLYLELEGTPVKLAPPPSTAEVASSTPGDTTSQPLPQVLLLSSGELAPFTISVSSDADPAAYTIKGSLADGVQLIEPDAKTGGR